MSRSREKKHIVYITDENYAMPTAVSIISLIMNNSSAAFYDVHVLGNGLSERTKEILRSIKDENVACNVISVPQNKYENLAQTCLTEGIHVTDTALYKFDIANLLDSVDLALYLDSDILICKDISELFSTELSDNYLAAVDEMGDEFDSRGRSRLALRIGLESSSYFNSGVLLLNLAQLRKENAADKLLEYRKTQTNYFMDQDAFNAVMHKRRVKLPYCYDFRTALFDVMLPEEIGETFYQDKYLTVQDCLDDQKVIHMSSQFKPWKYNIPWITDLFFQYYNMSPYKEEVLPLKSSLKGLYDAYEQWKKSAEYITEQFEILLSKYRQASEERNQKIWGFPYARIKPQSKVVLYGAGDMGRDFKMQIEATDYCSLVLWVDKNYQQMEDSVKAPKEIKGCVFDYVLVAIVKEEIVRAVKEYLKELDVAREKIIIL